MLTLYSINLLKQPASDHLASMKKCDRLDPATEVSSQWLANITLLVRIYFTFADRFNDGWHFHQKISKGWRWRELKKICGEKV